MMYRLDLVCPHISQSLGNAEIRLGCLSVLFQAFWVQQCSVQGRASVTYNRLDRHENTSNVVSCQGLHDFLLKARYIIF